MYIEFLLSQKWLEQLSGSVKSDKMSRLVWKQKKHPVQNSNIYTQYYIQIIGINGHETPRQLTIF